MAANNHFKREVLAEDPQRPGIPTVIQSGSFLFLSSVDGVRDPNTGDLDYESFGDGPKQARNAYQSLVQRLEECGLDGRSLVRIEHATASQDWRLDRMALWPELFGTPTHAVSQGYQGKMAGQNMITVTGLATTDSKSVEIITPGPSQGRAARINRVSPFIFVIGVRGHTDLATGDTAEEETPDAFAQQVHFAHRNIEHHLAAAGVGRDRLVRFDCFLRDINRAMEQRDLRTDYFEGRMDVASTVVACPLGGRTDIELSAMAIVPDEEKQVTFYEGRTDLARAVQAAGFVFASGALGDRGVDGKPRPEVYGKFGPQLDLALDRLEASLDGFDTPVEAIVRLDIYLKDPYRSEDALAWVARRFNGNAPTVVLHGIDLAPTAEVELTAMAAAPVG